MGLLEKIALACLPGIGSVLARNLISYCGSAEDVFRCRKKDLCKVPGIGAKTVESIRKHDVFGRAEEEISFLERFGIQPLFIGEENYPKRLMNCTDAPVLLYFKGNADLNNSRVISIVGTRNSTDYGREICRDLISGLCHHEPLVVSGLAFGIDYAAHREAVRNSIATVGVMAHGLDRVYPSQHRALAEKMIGNGGLLTEFMSGTIPDRENFPKRNRIIAGLADATIVVEANTKGGALITADIANSYNRDVFAYPGRIGDMFSSGCNNLIKTSRAHLITGLADLEYILGWSRLAEPKPPAQLSLMLDITADERAIADLLSDRGPMQVDDLAIASGFAQSKLAVNILAMEMKGLVIGLPGKMYRLASR